MNIVTSHSVDISELVETSKKMVSGKQLLDALKFFANIYPGIDVDELHASTVKIMQDYPLQTLVTNVALSRDGRVIGKRPGVDLNKGNDSQNEEVIFIEMVKYYRIHIEITTAGRIWPALETLLLEHHITERELAEISSCSPVVPLGREQMIAKGLFSGFEKDFVSAIHILIPQVEHMVRWHLKSRNVTTTVLNQDGIENEIGLSGLLDKPEVEDILGRISPSN